MLKQRVITGIIMGVVFLGCLFLLPWKGFLIFSTLVLLAGAWEWSNLSGFEARWQRAIYTLATALLMVVLGFLVNMPWIEVEPLRAVMVVACGWWALALLWVQGYPSSSVLWGSPWMRVMMGWLVLLPGWLALAYLHHLKHGPWLILLAMGTVFLADTGAYFTGRAFGKRKLAPRVSPGKSWEGVFGGLVLVSLLAVGIGLWLGVSNLIGLIAVMVITAAVSVLGDLLESMIKRHRDIKDSGTLLPGHGGVMDRLDSLSAALPVFTLGLISIGGLG